MWPPASRQPLVSVSYSTHVAGCPPCRGFTPALVTAYNNHLKAKGLEIIFVSSDRDVAQFQEYFRTMPWLAIAQGDKRKSGLSKLFGVTGIPQLTFINLEDGATITTEGRACVSSDPEGAEFPWYPKAFCNLSAGEGVGGINEDLALCLMVEGCDQATKDAAKAVLEPIAEAKKTAKEEMLFFYAPSAEGPAVKVRELTKLGQPKPHPQLILLDIPDSGGFYSSEATTVTPDNVNAFLEAYKAKTLERHQLGA